MLDQVSVSLKIMIHFLYISEYKFTIENKNEQKKFIHQTSKHLRMPGMKLKTIKFNYI